MKIKTYVQRNNRWVMEVQEVNRWEHYWISWQVISSYYRSKVQNWWEGY